MNREEANVQLAVCQQLSLWMRAVNVQQQRAQEQIHIVDRHMDAYLFVLAVRQVLLGAEAFAKATKDVETMAALDQFLVDVPDAKDLRDVLSHFDEYATGKGKLQREGKMESTFEISTELGDGLPTERRVWLRINHLRVELGSAGSSAIRLGLVTLNSYDRPRRSGQS